MDYQKTFIEDSDHMKALSLIFVKNQVSVA